MYKTTWKNQPRSSLVSPELVPVTLGPGMLANSRAALPSPAGVHPLKADRGSPTVVLRRFTSWRQKAQNSLEQLSSSVLLPASVDRAKVSQHLIRNSRPAWSHGVGYTWEAFRMAVEGSASCTHPRLRGHLGAPGHSGSAPLAHPPPRGLFLRAEPPLQKWPTRETVCKQAALKSRLSQ